MGLNPLVTIFFSITKSTNEQKSTWLTCTVLARLRCCGGVKIELVDIEAFSDSCQLVLDRHCDV